MLSLDDVRWNNLTGGYKVPFDPRPLLADLETGQNTETIWQDLWEELHHQGDVGTASYASVPFLVNAYRKVRNVDWNAYALVAIIELARNQGDNPGVPKYLEEDYFNAIKELAEIGRTELPQAQDPESVRAILSILAIAKGLRAHGKFLIEYSEEELLDIESRV